MTLKGCVDEITMRFKLAALCDASSQKAVARRFGYSPQFINDVIAGRRYVTDGLAAMMGFHRRVVFQNAQKARRAVVRRERLAQNRMV